MDYSLLSIQIKRKKKRRSMPLAERLSTFHCPHGTLTSLRADLPDTLEVVISQLRTGGAQNLGAVSLPDADTLLDQAATISSGPGYITLDQISHAEQLYATNVAWIPLAQGTFA
jgi:hypothetical protein